MHTGVRGGVPGVVKRNIYMLSVIIVEHWRVLCTAVRTLPIRETCSKHRPLPVASIGIPSNHTDDGLGSSSAWSDEAC